ncbi:hypothetical protein [Pelagibaculum spongiae]|uniref:Uncharacterized protein n=1 Tax=Pelagibaculum spongiae TaxID=2080658 RepID=A0A2V1GPA4_9GAMM|nr:hypothetical protein [Pelagibaculum spongiae]PVZ64534.1 hypothetical protein DC094_19680 [Pelagibaculum spongiae]
MKLGDYSLDILGGKLQKDGYILMKDNTQYKLLMINFSDKKCDAKVKIDGKLIGIWRVEPKQHIIIDRPSADTGLLTYYELGGEHSEKAQLFLNESLGLISVTYLPEKIKDTPQSTKTPALLGRQQASSICLAQKAPPYYCQPKAQEGCYQQAGGTGLSGESSQFFSRAEQINYQEESARTINVRLYSSNSDEARPLY